MKREPRLGACVLYIAMPLFGCGGGTTSTASPDAASVGSDGGPSTSGDGGPSTSGDEASADAAEIDSSPDAVCPEFSTVPDAAIVFTCEAAPAGSVGCQWPIGDPNAAVYPEGCTLKQPQPACTAKCCLTMACMCQQMNLANPRDGGLVFACAG